MMHPFGTKRRTAASRNSVAIGGTADMPRTRLARRSDAFDPGCVKTLRGMIAPEILRRVVTFRAKKCRNLFSARHYDQIRFRFRTAKTQSGSGAVQFAATHNN